LEHLPKRLLRTKLILVKNKPPVAFATGGL
jgi:hypothetical protein